MKEVELKGFSLELIQNKVLSFF